MKLQNLTVIFIIIILPIILVLSQYIGFEIKTITKQNMYNSGLVSATHDAIFSFEINTKNDSFTNNPEEKRSNIKAAVKTFENSLSNTCNLGLYNNEAIETYIPAIVFCLYDGFYMYAPSQQNAKYQHNLRNYVYYSEKIQQGNMDIVVQYTLDNYIAISGTIAGNYVTKAGYLINLNDCVVNGTTVTYKGIEIEGENTCEYISKNDKNEYKNKEDIAGKQYYIDAYNFTKWFKDNIKNIDYLNISGTNDPEDENSKFVEHKRIIMRQKIEETLNSSITAYAKKTTNYYKMPKFTEEDWSKIYNNIAVISFVQGMNLGFKDFNNYCILNSTNNQEYVNPNLIYFTDGNNYHDIRCEEIKTKSTTGYKIGSFEKVKYEIKNDEKEVIDTDYFYRHNELACYHCINDSLNAKENIYDYVRNSETNDKVKKSYFTALGRERYKTIKLLSDYNVQEVKKYTVKFDSGVVRNATNIPESQTVERGTPIVIPNKIPQDPNQNRQFSHWVTPSGTIINPTTDEDNPSIYRGYEDVTLTAVWDDLYWIHYIDDERPYINKTSSKVTKEEMYNNGGIYIDYAPNPNGFQFSGWEDRYRNIESPVTSNHIYVPSRKVILKYPGETRLYAQYKKITLSSISVQMNKTTFLEGETISKSDMTVTAYFTNNSFQTVTDFTITKPTGQLKTTDTQVTVSYTSGGITKTATANITVQAKEKVARVKSKGTQTYSSLQAAIDAANKNNDEIYLIKDIENVSKITINKNVNIYGLDVSSGHYTTKKLGNAFLIIENNCTVNFNYLDIDGYTTIGGSTINNHGTLTINGGTYKKTNGYVINNYGDLTLNDGSFISSKSSPYIKLEREFEAIMCQKDSSSSSSVITLGYNYLNDNGRIKGIGKQIRMRSGTMINVPRGFDSNRIESQGESNVIVRAY